VAVTCAQDEDVVPATLVSVTDRYLRAYIGAPMDRTFCFATGTLPDGSAEVHVDVEMDQPEYHLAWSEAKAKLATRPAELMVQYCPDDAVTAVRELTHGAACTRPAAPGTQRVIMVASHQYAAVLVSVTVRDVKQKADTLTAVAEQIAYEVVRRTVGLRWDGYRWATS
jgi:hypothetical protein